MPIPTVGSPAPDFTLRSTTGDDFALASRRGNSPVLLAFFPLAFTGTCTAEMCEMRDDFGSLTGTGVEIVPISVDSADTLKEFKRQHDLPMNLLSDFKREVSRKYGVLSEEKFHANRSYFVIDRAGIVRWAYVEQRNSLKRSSAEIRAEIAKLQG